MGNTPYFNFGNTAPQVPCICSLLSGGWSSVRTLKFLENFISYGMMMRAFAERHELVLAMLLSARKAHQCNLSLPLCLLPNCRTCGFHTNEIYRIWVAFKHRQRKNSEHSQRLTAEACSDVQADSVQPPSLPSRMFLK